MTKHAFWCKPWEECTCHQELHLAPRKKKFDAKDYGLGAGKNQTKAGDINEK